ncbi:MAG: 3-isopropylmalate dehydratase small subunit [Pseudomonadota bacterium]
MKAFRRITAGAVPLRRVNVDTDAISPGSQLLKVAVTKSGYGGCLFYNWRFREDGSEEPDFVLNRPRYRTARILLAGHNFACGSSREVAVWALRDYGFECVIAPSFGNIFYSNMFKNGLLPVTLAEEDVEAICDEVEAQDGATPVTVDLEANQVISPSGRLFPFRIPEIHRQALLDGLDAITATLRFSADIAAFQERDRRIRRWAYFSDSPVASVPLSPVLKSAK